VDGGCEGVGAAASGVFASGSIAAFTSAPVPGSSLPSAVMIRLLLLLLLAAIESVASETSVMTTEGAGIGGGNAAPASAVTTGCDETAEGTDTGAASSRGLITRL
jgi:hypothetical protein